MNRICYFLINSFVLLLPLQAASQMTTDAANAVVPAAPNNLLGNSTAHLYFARAYGSCTWDADAASDVGPCINAAISAASAPPAVGEPPGGGRVILPVGNFSLRTSVVLASKVRLIGAGGSPFDNCGTKLTWNGPADGTIVQIGNSTITSPLVRPGLSEMCLHGNGSAAIAVDQWSTSTGFFENIQINAVKSAGWRLDSANGVEIARNAFNEYRQITIDLTKVPNSTDADGLVLNNSNTSGADANRNNWFGLTVLHQNGEGVKCKAADNNTFVNLQTEPSGGGTGIGLHLYGTDTQGVARCMGNAFVLPSIGKGSSGGIVASAGAYQDAQGNWIFLRKSTDGQPTVIDDTAGKNGVFYIGQGGNTNRVTSPAESRPSNPTGSSSAVWTMMGLRVSGAGITYKPRSSGLVEITAVFDQQNTNTGGAGCFKIIYGEGSAPNNSDAQPAGSTGVGAMGCQQFANASASHRSVVTGTATMTAGTTNWIDLGAFAFAGAGTITPTNITVTAKEL
jgi:hypothetical protein